MTWKPGQSGNPNGRKTEAKQELERRVGRAFLADFITHGAKAIRDMREESPTEYCKTVVRLMPKEHKLHVQHDYLLVLKQAMAQIDAAPRDDTGRRKLEHLAASQALNETQGSMTDWLEGETVPIEEGQGEE